MLVTLRLPRMVISGPGSWESNAAAREAFGHAALLSGDAITTYSLAGAMGETAWIDLTWWDSIVIPRPG